MRPTSGTDPWVGPLALGAGFGPGHGSGPSVSGAMPQAGMGWAFGPRGWFWFWPRFRAFRICGGAPVWDGSGLWPSGLVLVLATVPGLQNLGRCPSLGWVGVGWAFGPWGGMGWAFGPSGGRVSECEKHVGLLIAPVCGLRPIRWARERMRVPVGSGAGLACGIGAREDRQCGGDWWCESSRVEIDGTQRDTTGDRGSRR
jgi:hypothetical protein